MKIVNLLVNRLEKPLGFWLPSPSFSYEVTDTSALRQISARIEISAKKTFSDRVYDSGKREDIDRLDFEPPVRLEPSTRYYWKVWVKGDNGEEAESDVSWFETPKEDAWVGKWISPKADKKIQATVYRDFCIEKPVKKARLYGVGLGVYELYLNGEKQGDEYLMPGLHDYDSWIQYQTYEIALKQGDNRLEFMLGNGWYKGLYSLVFQENNYGDRLACIADLVIWYEDGSREVIGTDTRWKARKNHVAESGIYNGEFYDAAMDVSQIFDTEEIGLGTERLRPRLSPSITAQESLKPSLLKTPAGETVLDMGQNMVGWLSFRDTLPRGAKVKFQFGEILQNGNFYRDNLRKAKAEFLYVSDGAGAQVRPHFTFYGFRYVKISGWPGEPEPENFTGIVLHSRVDPIGDIETSDPLVNRLIHNAKWGQKGNFLDVPTDCPQRDERMGWTGDAQIFSGTACYNTDAYAFYVKFGYDLFCEQKKLGGSVPHVVPTSNLRGNGSTGWGEAATVIPWNVYLHYGKKDILRRQYDSMKGWVEFIKGQDDKYGAKRLWKGGFHYGDWLALDGPVKGGVYGATDPDFIATAYYYHSTDLLRKAAEVLGYREDAEKYGTLASEIREAFRREYFTPAGNLSVNTMTAHVMALFLDLAPESARERTRQGLRDQLKAHGYHLSTGFVGTPYLCRALSDNGMNEYAYHLLLEKGYPGWLYEVLMGATTVWERWNSVLPDGSISGTAMNSLNHYAYGSILEWMYRDMIGIRPSEEAPGFRRAVISPRPNYQIRWAKCSLKSAAGTYRVGWNLEGKTLTLEVEIPFDTQAELILPDARAAEVRISGNVSLRQEGNDVYAEVGTGKYRISYPMTANFRKVYSIYSPTEELLENPRTAQLLREEVFSWKNGEKKKEVPETKAGLKAAYQAVTFSKETPMLVDLMRTPSIAVPQEIQKELDRRLKSME